MRQKSLSAALTLLGLAVALAACEKKEPRRYAGAPETVTDDDGTEGVDTSADVRSTGTPGALVQSPPSEGSPEPPVPVDASEDRRVESVLPPPDAELFASATLAPTGKDSGLSGTVRFFDTRAERNGMLVIAEVEGVTPGQHGIHIHERGDCSRGGEAAGGHWNPDGSPHAAPTSPQHHAGDLGNIDVLPSGRGVLELTLLAPDSGMGNVNMQEGVMGKSVVLHAQPDDLRSQPAGDSGARIACGVITRASGPGR